MNVNKKPFPRTEVAGKSLSRMIIGTNWVLGWSHTSPAADKLIGRLYDKPEKIVPLLEAYLDFGIDTLMGPISEQPMLQAAIKLAEDKTGKRIMKVDTPLVNVSDSEKDRREAEAAIKRSASSGADFCLIHHASAEQLVNKNLAIISRIDDYTKMIRDAGIIPGLSAHMPELVIYSDENGYDIETYIQIYNCMGFLMQVEAETIAKVIHSAKKPVMTIKPMAAGRCTPYVGLNFSWNTIRENDMVTIGAFNVDEVLEDIEISFAAIERRLPDIGKRSSPDNHQAAFGNI
ncbi:MAG TPA: hypothetical protein VM577_20650 [Anaerovoracaceae bacterium]|nr:hypothetical protein [Anaerovoracaceae bacterium]